MMTGRNIRNVVLAGDGIGDHPTVESRWSNTKVVRRSVAFQVSIKWGRRDNKAELSVRTRADFLTSKSLKGKSSALAGTGIQNKGLTIRLKS